MVWGGDKISFACGYPVFPGQFVKDSFPIELSWQLDFIQESEFKKFTVEVKVIWNQLVS